MDRITKQQRSKNMAAVRSRGNASTELALAKIFRKEKIIGWSRHKKIHGIRPDFVFPKRKLAVFVHGCFWHGCRLHRNIPSSNVKFWREKIAVNKRRDARATGCLQASGWKVLRFWEHEIKKNPERIIGKIKKTLA